jgi:hypothetical protein
MSIASLTAHSRSQGPSLRAATVLGLLVVTALTYPAAVSAERLTDKDVKALMERIDHERDRFEDQLDGKLKRSIVRGPGGEVNVERHLDDLQENVDKMKDRYTGRYAASQEVTTVLQQGSGIQRFMAAQAPNMDGASEWNKLSASLGELAAVYGTSFPLSAGQAARRLSDDEVQSAAKAVAESADQFKKDLDNSLKKDKTIDANARKAAVKEADDLKKDAKALADVVGGGRPASGEARALVGRAARLKTASATWPLSPAAQTSWRSVEGGLDKITQAFALPPG